MIHPLIDAYTDYLLTVKGYSRHTLSSYSYDLIWLFRYLLIRNGNISIADLPVKTFDGRKVTDFEGIDITPVDLTMLGNVRYPDLFAFLSFCAKELENDQASRKRKVTATKGFFHFLVQVRKELPFDPSVELEAPKLGKHYPRYLTLEQAQDLLGAVSGRYEIRDRCILTMFLNTGLRVSELCRMRCTDIQGDVVHVNGKGNKDRTLYLNDSVLQTLSAWLDFREALLLEKHLESPYLFLSQKGGPFTNRGIEYLVEKYIKKIGLDPRGYTVHTLRHTAATLMHKYGEVDIRTLQAVLGHESTQTTEIYTHLDSEEYQKAMRANPLANWDTDEDADVSNVYSLNRQK